MATTPDAPACASPDALLKQHTALAYGIAKRYARRGLPLEDLRQEALLGLLDAANSFDPAKGAGFTTYATFWIVKRLTLALDREGKSGGNLAGSTDVDRLADHTEPIGQDHACLAVRVAPKAGGNAMQPDRLILPADLPDAECAVLEACYRQRLPLKQVAARMGLRVEQVKQLRAKALRRIRNQWGC